MYCYRLIYCLIIILSFSQFVFMPSAQAQMYQWTDPETGTTQLSGKPPAWYRSVEGGPRVFVFNRGKVVDDTGIETSDEQRINLRTKAFVSAEEDRLAAREKAVEAAKLKAAMERNADETAGAMIEDTELAEESRDEVVAMPVEEELVETETSEDEDSVAKMKALIVEWESKRTEEARDLIQKGGNGT